MPNLNSQLQSWGSIAIPTTWWRVWTPQKCARCQKVNLPSDSLLRELWRAADESARSPFAHSAVVRLVVTTSVRD